VDSRGQSRGAPLTHLADSPVASKSPIVRVSTPSGRDTSSGIAAGDHPVERFSILVSRQTRLPGGRQLDHGAPRSRSDLQFSRIFSRILSRRRRDGASEKKQLARKFRTLPRISRPILFFLPLALLFLLFPVVVSPLNRRQLGTMYRRGFAPYAKQFSEFIRVYRARDLLLRQHRRLRKSHMISFCNNQRTGGGKKI